MRNYILILVFLSASLAMRAQDYKIESFVSTTEMAARENIKQDHKDRQCAVLRIATQKITPEQREGFYFGCDYGSSVVDRQIKGGEIWLWVSPGIKTLKIYHDELGNIELHTGVYGITVQSLFTYKIVIKGTMEINPNGKPKVTQQFLVFKVEPNDAMVTVNGEPWPVVDGVAQKRVNFGQYEYRIEAQDYHSVDSVVNVSNTKVVVEKSLRPAFGYLKIEGDLAILRKASIHIDNANGSDALYAPKKLSSGTHRLLVAHSKYKVYDQYVTISDGVTNVVKVDLNANYATVTLTVDADAEIWVDGEKKDVRTWTGDLEVGSHTFECRMANHTPTLMQATITENMAGQTIPLDAPTPLMGMLVMSTIPVANIFIDNKSAGETPIQTNLTVGKHILRMEKKGYQPLEKTIFIEENKTLVMEENLKEIPKPEVKEKPKKEEKKPKKEKPVKPTMNQVWFATLNFAYDPSPQSSFGFTVGSVKKFGWYFSAMSNFGFKALQYDYVADAEGYVDGEIPSYTGESCTTRLSVMAGALMRVAEPLCLRAGVGYGNRVKSWYTADNALVNVSDDSWSGVDVSIGAQFHLKGFVLSLDAVTTSFKNMEIKAGVGYSW